MKTRYEVSSFPEIKKIAKFLKSFNSENTIRVAEVCSGVGALTASLKIAYDELYDTLYSLQDSTTEVNDSEVLASIYKMPLSMVFVCDLNPEVVDIFCQIHSDIMAPDCLIHKDKIEVLTSSQQDMLTDPSKTYLFKDGKQKNTKIPHKIPSMDVLLFSPPCTSYSNAGKKQGATVESGQVFNEGIKLIDQASQKPKMIIIEEASEIAKYSVSEQMVNQLQSRGYSVNTQILNAIDFGVPATRKRWYLYAVSNAVYDWSFIPKINFPLVKTQTIASIVDTNIDPERKDVKLFPSIQPYFDALVEKNFFAMPKKSTCRLPTLKTQHLEDKKEIQFTLYKSGTLHCSHVTSKNTFRRWDANTFYYCGADTSETFHTVTSSHATEYKVYYRHEDQWKARSLTLEEVGKIQGFPDYMNQVLVDFPLSVKTKGKFIGNSVAVPVVASLIKNVFRLIMESYNPEKTSATMFWNQPNAGFFSQKTEDQRGALKRSLNDDANLPNKRHCNGLFPNPPEFSLVFEEPEPTELVNKK